MSRSQRTLRFATAASVALHVAVLGGVPALRIDREAAAPPPPLDVHLAAARPTPAALPERSMQARAPGEHARKRAERPSSTGGADMPSRAEAPPAADGDVGAPLALAGAGEAGTGAAADGALPASAAPEAVPDAENGPPAAAYPIRRLAAVYDLFYANDAPDAPVGRVTLSFTADGERYVAESVAEGVGLVSLFYGGQFAQRSEGRIGAEGLVPERYTLRRGGDAITDEARFDWAAATVVLASKGERRTAAIERGAQDPLSAMHQFYFVQPLAASGRFSVADGRRLRVYWYELVGEELVETTLGVVNALHMRRADGASTSADVWVDPRRSYLPVKILATDRKGRLLAQHIRSLEIEPLATVAADAASR